MPSTVGEALAAARRALADRSDTPELDGQLLLAEALGVPRTWVLAHTEARLLPEPGARFRAALDRCLSGQALPYVLGWWEFYGRRFCLSPDVLIPRPETESLVEAALEVLADAPTPAGSFRTVDVGTGSGCIAVSLAAEVPGLRVIATDRCGAALRVARQNAQAHHMSDRLRLVQADMLEPLRCRFDLVCANLPYIPSQTLESLPVARREPRAALDGGRDGLDLIRRLLAQLPGVLRQNGTALLEIGADQGSAVAGLAGKALPGAEVRIIPDLTGRDRLVSIRGCN